MVGEGNIGGEGGRGGEYWRGEGGRGSGLLSGSSDYLGECFNECGQAGLAVCAS